jgi:hypothetical protein
LEEGSLRRATWKRAAWKRAARRAAWKKNILCNCPKFNSNNMQSSIIKGQSHINLN